MKAAAVLVLTLAACSYGPSKAYAPTLLVTNATCSSGQCGAFYVLAYDQSMQGPPPFPGDDGWYIRLGTVTSASRCMTFPHSMTWSGNGQLIATGTVADAFALRVGDTLTGDHGPLTNTFVPEDRRGWGVT